MFSQNMDAWGPAESRGWRWLRHSVWHGLGVQAAREWGGMYIMTARIAQHTTVSATCSGEGLLPHSNRSVTWVTHTVYPERVAQAVRCRRCRSAERKHLKPGIACYPPGELTASIHVYAAYMSQWRPGTSEVTVSLMAWHGVRTIFFYFTASSYSLDEHLAQVGMSNAMLLSLTTSDTSSYLQLPVPGRRAGGAKLCCTPLDCNCANAR